MPRIQIRPATADDLVAINEIYNYYVLNSTCTYQTEPETMEARRAWLADHDAKHPVTVAHLEDGLLVGWGSLTLFHRRAAYGRTLENSVYVHHEHHRQGIGRAILRDLIDRAKALSHHTIIALISADQSASVALHAEEGFVQVALLKEVGFKFERWLDVVYMQKML
jgi:L-amino acid N-acyltransferase